MRRPCSPRTSWVCVARMTGESLLVLGSIWRGTSGIEGGNTDISHGGRNSDFDARVSLLCQLALEEFVQFGVEDAVCDELPTLRDGCCSGGSHGWGGIGGSWCRREERRRWRLCFDIGRKRGPRVGVVGLGIASYDKMALVTFMRDNLTYRYHWTFVKLGLCWGAASTSLQQTGETRLL